MELLLDNEGVKVDQARHDDETALSIAHRQGHKKGVERLLRKYVTKGITVTYSNGATLLHIAASNGHKHLVNLLLAR